MATIDFHPHFQAVFGPVLREVADGGTTAVTCPPDVDTVVLARQIARFAAKQGVSVRCEPRGSSVRVVGPTNGQGRVTPGSRRAG